MGAYVGTSVTVAETLSLAGAPTPAELADLVQHLHIHAPVSTPALNGSSAAEDMPVAEIIGMVAGWALAEDDSDVVELEVDEAISELEASASEQLQQMQEAGAAAAEEAEKAAAAQAADAATCPSMAEALEALANLQKYARHHMSEAAQLKLQSWSRLMSRERLFGTKKRSQTKLTSHMFTVQ